MSDILSKYHVTKYNRMVARPPPKATPHAMRTLHAKGGCKGWCISLHEGRQPMLTALALCTWHVWAYVFVIRHTNTLFDFARQAGRGNAFSGRLTD